MSSNHNGVLLSILCLCAISCTEVFGYSSVISVRNGGPWGEWEYRENCPKGWIAYGYALKVDDSQGSGDDTGLNGIQLFCKASADSTETHRIESGMGQWGTWTSPKWCKNSFLKAFILKVQQPQGYGDDTAATDIKFICSDDTIAKKGRVMARWGDQSSACEKGISGIQTKVEPPQGSGDDSALNDVRFFCR
ncbi:vitelline membrane outer layer protein 1 homolog [Polypterus senegalus]|uniref:vitelline membrane outer layer protein 1 homolog n=1 Tax=Polypterus senegalus TaxID=55291 RepID=UPI0019659A0D|nr:vitelline membrane outer layer protein 1 homolog [Polypterus senegalus]